MTSPENLSKSIITRSANHTLFCPCCREVYTDRCGQNRVLLDCLHPICAACIRLAEDLLKALDTSKTQAKEGFFLCPFCHTETNFETLRKRAPPPPPPPRHSSSAVGRRRRFRSRRAQNGGGGLIASISECTLSSWPNEDEDGSSENPKRKR